MKLPRFGLTMGDPNGIGPEIIIKAIHQLQPLTSWKPLVFGDLSVLQEVNAMLGNPLQFCEFNKLSPSPESVSVLNLAVSENRQWQPGKRCAWGGESSFVFLTEAIRWAMNNEISAIVTAPLCKEAMHEAGHFYPGHTEILSLQTNQALPVMMLVVDELRAIHVTTHMPLKEAIASLTIERILKVISIADKTLRQMGIQNPKFGIPGLNPHASENGLFGEEEREIIIPAIEEAEKQGIDCRGPVSPDVIFLQHREGIFDAVIALYHDQAHIPLKLLGFERGVNVTLGLPVIRTSVDHGTAFDRAALFQSDPSSMIHAIRFAQRLVSNHSALI
ncbi:MAG: 4-hydroxythreonine-4-phosphate dehydrogenase PdxA [SAR324 cluster bacterium]|nr:4-hydroxythreonine-4-phosphate dehydrogenase PdxA [SAR324 cluster bacterium]